MNNLKKVLSLALVICMLLTVLPLQAKAESAVITDYQEFIQNLAVLEEYAVSYSAANPGKDPASLVMKYIRTGVDEYDSGFWNVIAGNGDSKFDSFVSSKEAAHNAANPSSPVNVSGLKGLGQLQTPNGDKVEMGHVFAVMDVSCHNEGDNLYTDAAGWVGGVVALMVLADSEDVSGTVEEMVTELREDYFLDEGFTQADAYADLDGYALASKLMAADYSAGLLTNLVKGYYTAALTDEQRGGYFLENRLDGMTDRGDIRKEIFNSYTGSSVAASLEAGETFATDELSDLRKACCYVFADYLCQLAGDSVEWNENIYYEIKSSEKTTISPGVTLETVTAQSADDKQMLYYLATADVSNPYVDVYVNYKDNDPTLGWGMQSVRDQAHAAEARHTDPNTENYVPNYDVVLAVNGAGYNMSTGEPAGLMMMEGVEYQAPDGQDHDGYGFFGILKDGSAIIASTEDYYDLKAKGEIMEGIDNFGCTLVKDGKLAYQYWDSHTQARETRTAVGITKTGKVIFMVLEGRQEPRSCGGSFAEIAQIMLDAGCVDAINLDGGGSSTMLAQRSGQSDIELVNNPSDGFERRVSASLMVVSTLPGNDSFDHAQLSTEENYLTVGSAVQISAKGISASGKETALPGDVVWTVSNDKVATVSNSGVVTGVANGQVDVRLMQGDKIVGSKTLNVVGPDVVYFTSSSINAVYGQAAKLPVAALYKGKAVAINEKDVSFTLSNANAGTVSGFTFTGSEASGIKTVKINAHAVNNPSATSGSMTIALFKAGETYFDFENANGGDRLLAWNRTVSNAETSDGVTYNIVDVQKAMVTEYTFGMDMSQLPISQELNQQIYAQLGAAAKDNAGAWELMLNQADKVSTQTQVKATVKFDKNFQVDYSKLAVTGDYFTLGKTSFNAETNELTLSLNWKAQTKAIDPAAANPVVILSGVKLTPTGSAAWDSKDRLAVVNTGDVSYEICLCSNALYTYAQSATGLKPFVNPDNNSEKGASFTAATAEFADEFTLNKSLKSGWVFESVGYAYYENGVKYTGVRKVGQFYYDFGDDGINVGQTKYTGIFQQGGVNYYAKEGQLTGGWINQGNDKYLFDQNGKAVDGKQTIDGVEMNFNNGLLVSGFTGFKKDGDNTYYYQNGSKCFGWLQLGDKWYHFDGETGNMTVGDGTPNSKLLPDKEAKAKGAYYVFAADGQALYGFPNGYGYYYWAGQPMRNQWVRNGNDLDGWYYTNEYGHYVTTPNAAETFKLTLDGKTYTAVKIAVEGVEYTFDNGSGKLLLGSLVLKEGKWFYYWAGSPVNEGWFQFGGNTYYAFSDGHLATGAVTIGGKYYMFTPQGALIEGGIQVQVALGKDNSTMDVKVVNADPAMTSARVAIWAVNAGQADTLQWIDLAKNGDNWETRISMCTFGVTKTDSFELHVYGVVNGAEGLVINTSVDHMAPAGHDYESEFDYKCNGCGLERIVDMTRPMVDMFRMYDPNSGEHFYTGSTEERDNLVAVGWQYEGVGFTFPLTTGKPVYRLYDPVTGEHLYTMDENEKATLMAAGWNYEGIAFNSGFENEVPQYRLHNPNATRGAYHFTASAEERDMLLSLGWEYQGIGWYSLGA